MLIEIVRQHCSECQTLYYALEYNTRNSQPGPGAVIFAVGAGRDFCVVVAEDELRLLLVVPCNAHSGGRGGNASAPVTVLQACRR